MSKFYALFLLAATLAFASAEEAAQVTGVADGKQLQLTPELQQRLIEDAAKLLANCSNTVIEPKRTLESAKRKSHLHFIFTEPRSFDLGVEKNTTGATNVQVKEMVMTLPLTSGGAWIKSTKFRWFCSNYNGEIIEEMEKTLKSAQKP